MSDKYLSLNELADWAAGTLYNVNEDTQSVQLGFDPRRTYVSGLLISSNPAKKDLLRKIIDNPEADWSNTGIDEEIILQIRLAKHDPSDSAKEFMHAIHAFVASFYDAQSLMYVYEHIAEINNRLVKTFWIRWLLAVPGEINVLTDVQEAKLTLELLQSYPYTDQCLINGYSGNINLYSVSHNYNMKQVYDWFYNLMWNRVIAEASKAEPDKTKIENLCNVAIVKLIGIYYARPESKLNKSVTEYSLRSIFNIDCIFNFVKGHAEEISQHDTFLNQVRLNEAQATMYQKATAQRLTQQNTTFVSKEPNARNG